jgi:hypothetical protein
LKRIKRTLFEGAPGFGALGACAADLVAAAQKADLAALEEIGNGGGGFTGIAAAARHGQNKVTEGELGPMDFANVFFHMGVSV